MSKQQTHVAITMEPDLKEKVADAARDNGTSFSEEVRRRLWLSFGGSKELVRMQERYQNAWASHDWTNHEWNDCRKS